MNNARHATAPADQFIQYTPETCPGRPCSSECDHRSPALRPVTMRPHQRLLCCHCGKWAGDVFADLTGPAFKAFVCKPCLPKYKKEKREAQQ